MAKYIANPVEVDAFKITEIGPIRGDGSRWLGYDDGECSSGLGIYAEAALMARYNPALGDYIVRQHDGYTYVNPKEVFERKYHAA